VFASGTSGRRYPKPIAENCTSCHVDYHDGTFVTAPGGMECDNCHGGREWYPTTYDLNRHNRESGFELAGAHLATPCSACHVRGDGEHPGPVFRFADQTCAACHGHDDPHQGQFPGRPCQDCHTQESFSIQAFDHNRTAFPLDGAHRDVPCASCHVPAVTEAGLTFTRYTQISTRCRDCHGGSP
jgi:hypothetical protein